MAQIDELTSFFEGTVDGPVAPGNSIFDNMSGSTATYSSAWKKQGNTSIRVNTTTTTSFLTVTGISYDNMWLDFYFRIDKVPTVASLIVSFLSGTAPYTTIAGIRINPIAGSTTTYNLSIRDGFNQVGSTIGPFNTQEQYRMAVKVDPNNATASGDGAGLVLKVFTAGNIDNMSATFTRTGASTINFPITRMSFGALTTDTGNTGLTLFMDDMRADDASQPVRSDAPTTGPITEWTEGFEDGTVGAEITANSIVDATVAGGTGQMLFFADPYANTKCGRIDVTNNNRGYRAYATTPIDSPFWFKFALKVATLPALSAAAVVAFYTGTTKICDIRVVPNGANYNLQVRNSASVDTWTSTATIATNAWVECAIRIIPTPEVTTDPITPLTGVFKYYAVPQLGTGTATQTSGTLTLTAGSEVKTVSELRFGVMAANTTDVRFDVFRAHTGSEPASIQPPGSTLAVTAANVVDVEPYSQFTLLGVATGGTPPYTYAWTDPAPGGDPALSPTNAATTSGTAPATTDGTTLTYRLTVTDNTATSVQANPTVTVLSHDHFSRNNANSTWDPIRQYSLNQVYQWI